MKLIMENWNKFLNQNEGPDPKWLAHIKQKAMEYLHANPGIEIADVPVKDILVHAGIDPDMDEEFVSLNDPELKSWWLFGAEGINDIRLGAQIDDMEAANVATDMPSAAPGAGTPGKLPALRETKK